MIHARINIVGIKIRVTLNESFSELNHLARLPMYRLQEQKRSARLMREHGGAKKGSGIKGIKGMKSETKGHNAVSVNCDARIKETVTPAGRERDGERGRARGYAIGMGASMREGGPAEVEGERDESLEVSQL